MPDWLAALILGVIEGFTEFIPVSSTGHLLIAEKWLGHKSDFFNVFIQCGAALALLPVFWKKLTEMALKWRTDAQVRTEIAQIGVAFIITVIGGLVIKKVLKFDLPDTLAPVAWATFIGALVIFAVEFWAKKRGINHERITWPIAILIGCAQLVAAAFPGASRSGSTIMLALGLGAARPAATHFSFLLGLPTLLAAGGYELLNTLKETTTPKEGWGATAIGLVAAAVSAFIVVKWLLRYVQSHSFMGFGIYRLVLGVFLLALAYKK
jgi:undecaprenyl-diphosphatase